MKNIVAINASPRSGWNTSTLVREATRGARKSGAEVRTFDLYKLEPYTGCISCFGCKRHASRGRCVCRDALTPVLEAIRQADGLILGTPNYLGAASAGFHALYERLIFQYITYERLEMCCNEHPIPVLLIMTGNAPCEAYTPHLPYGEMIAHYKAGLSGSIGPTRVFICGDTLQVSDYSQFQWTMFDPEAKKARRMNTFPKEMEAVYRLGEEMVASPWQ